MGNGTKYRTAIHLDDVDGTTVAVCLCDLSCDNTTQSSLKPFSLKPFHFIYFLPVSTVCKQAVISVGNKNLNDINRRAKKIFT